MEWVQITDCSTMWHRTIKY